MTFLGKGPSGRPPRLLVINPNTNPAVTEQVRAAAINAANGAAQIDAVNPDRGPLSIETESDRATAAAQVVTLVEATAGKGYDGYILACFDDLGIAEARQIAGNAFVISMFGASVDASMQVGGRVVIVTTADTALPSIQRLIDTYGIGSWCSARATGIGVAETADRSFRAEERLAATIQAAIEKDGASAIILGSGALTGRSAELESRFGVTIIDGLTAAVAMATWP